MPVKLSEYLFGPDGKQNVELLQFLAESAYLWSYRGEFARAAAIFEAVALLAPGDPTGRLGLAEVLISQRKFREAERAAEQATRAPRIDRRGLAFAYKLRGKALLQLNKPRDAEKMFRRAAEIDPQGPEGQSALKLLEVAKKLGLIAVPAAPASDKAAEETIGERKE